MPLSCSGGQGGRGKRTPMSVDFDAMLPHIGEMGRYQLGLYLMMCVPATLPAAFLAACSSLALSCSRNFLILSSWIFRLSSSRSLCFCSSNSSFALSSASSLSRRRLSMSSSILFASSTRLYDESVNFYKTIKYVYL